MQVELYYLERDEFNNISKMRLVGNVADKDVIIFDDIADTCGTIMQASLIMKKKHARKIIVVITHPIMSESAFENLDKSPIEILFLSNTIPIKKEVLDFFKIRNIKIVQVDVSAIFASSISKING